MPPFAVLWAAWAASLVVIEGVALYRKSPGDTLSETVRALTTLNRRRHRVTLVAWIAFAVWFAVHIWF